MDFISEDRHVIEVASGDDIVGLLRGEVLRRLESEILPAYVTARRWYGAKDAGRPRVKIAQAEPFGAGEHRALLATLAVTPPGQPAQTYFLPLALARGAERDAPAGATIARVQAGDAEARLIDAFASDGFVRALIAAIRDGSTPVSGEAADIIFRKTAAFAETASSLAGRPAIERSAAEQSNTSLRVGGAILKAFRKLASGIHPELEMTAFLTERARFANVPALLGAVERVEASGAATTLCVLQALVRNRGDGWSYAVERLKRSVQDSEAEADLLRLARRLGHRTAELHRALAGSTDDAAFAPERVDDARLFAWSNAVLAQARSALDGLERARSAMSPAAREQVDLLLARRRAVEGCITGSTPRRVEVMRTRIHGDYHLGQVLVSDDDVFIIDFEGEPLRPLAERREKQSSMRDVAGMLRSFAYAGAAAERALGSGERAAAASRLAALTREVSAAFLEAYGAVIRGCRSFPADPQHATQLLRLFLLEKALYEVSYELANRPDWLDIPLSGVLALLEEPGSANRRATEAAPGSLCLSEKAFSMTASAISARRAHSMPFGAELQADGTVRFRLWAPAQTKLSLVLEGEDARLPMTRQRDGWHELTTGRAKAGTLYRFELEDGLRVPDPASRHQPQDVHGPSEVVDPRSYLWSDAEWRGRPWHEAVIYELHVGTFTPEGTFRAAIGKLDHLVRLGVTAIELMPIADFAGQRNWGYDGVLLYAPDASYGRPEDLKALVDAAHARGLMVLLDVVYNHFGPDGNYLNAYACQFFTERHMTPWGAAINYDGPDSRAVRDFMIHNALYWLEEYHLDGLRLDAVHAIIDDSETHLLEELAARVRETFAGGRHIHLILENEENDAHRLEREGDGAPRLFTAQWNDDVHHVLHTAATGETAGYYAEYAGRADKLGRALAEGFAFQGEMMEYRGEPRGEPSRHLPPTAFVSFIQNHDQVGNRAFGDRLTASAPAEAVRAIASVYLLAPQIPMLFMGEEWATAQPFCFFCDFGAELGDAVRHGRRAEFARFPEFQDEDARERIPDPTAKETFRATKLVWEDLSRELHAGWLDWYRRILAVRRSEIVPRLTGLSRAGDYDVLGEGAVRVRWTLGDGSWLNLLANLSAEARAGAVPAGRTLWREGDIGADRLGPWSVAWSLEDAGASRS